MKKNFPLSLPNHKPPRVIEGIKSDIRKYLKRERRKELPEGVDFCDFDCRVGENVDSAKEIHLSELIKAVDKAAEESWESMYIEILSKPGHRQAKQ